MRYGMNPHQHATVVDGHEQVRVLNGEPSLINWLDLLNAWALVREAELATGAAAAASFKHVSPAGVALAGTIDACAREAWGLDEAKDGTLLSAYVRARDVDPTSSFGDAIALSAPCDAETAEFIGGVIADAIIAPGYEPAALARLRRKKSGRFLVMEMDPDYAPPAWETREVFGVALRQERDTAPVEQALLGADGLTGAQTTDALLGMITLRYTQSNSVTFGTQGMVLGIGAGQQNRVDCTRLAGTKARTWRLRRAPAVRHLDRGRQRRQDHLNWQTRFAQGSLTDQQLAVFADLYGAEAAARYRDGSWREQAGGGQGLVMCSDGFIPFRDNIDVAAELGADVVVEPGGSIRSDEVVTAAREQGITHLTTGLRLFHH